MSKLEIHADPRTAELCRQVVGMKYNDAIKLTDEAKLLMRIVWLDGKARQRSLEWHPQRVNVSVQGGEIIAAQVG